jgi:hypothetical protein
VQIEIEAADVAVDPGFRPVGAALDHAGELAIHGDLDVRAEEAAREAAAFLQISEVKQGEPTELLFSGWMFASSPALSALEHPIYDVVVVDCVASSSAPADSSSSPKPE